MSTVHGWTRDVLDFWFGELSQEDWWKKSDRTDRAVVTRFKTLVERLMREASPGAFVRAEEMLAAVIALDQFPRHIWRGDPRAFAADPLAFAIAEWAVEHGFDRELDVRRRRFLYMPYEHSEDPAAQARAIELFAGLDDPDALHYAHLHKVIIDRFGRFPHRNAVLGRIPTPEEIEFLKGPNSSF
ncbi:MAG: DUF924 family protein [Hyphomicrobiaceae bacterium]